MPVPPHLFPLRWPHLFRHGFGLLVALVLVLTSVSSGWAQELRFFRIGTGTTGGTYFPIGGLLANAISNPPSSRPCGRGGSCGVPGLIAVAQATSGSVENVNALRAGALEAALVQADIAHWAFIGQGVYRDKPPFTELRTIANLYTEAVHLVVRADSPIQRVSDLAGHAVSLGDEGSGILVEARILLAAYGLSESSIKPFYLRPGPSADRLAAGELDAFFMVGGFPVQAITDLAARVPIRLIPINDEPAVRLKGNFAYYTEVTIDANAYPGVPSVHTLGVGAQFVVRGELSDDLAYGITAALWHESTQQLLAEGHPKGRSIMLANALQGLSVPLHPGAERFYRQIGLLADK